MGETFFSSSTEENVATSDGHTTYNPIIASSSITMRPGVTNRGRSSGDSGTWP